MTVQSPTSAEACGAHSPAAASGLTRGLIIASLLVLGATLPGCGGDDDETLNTEPELRLSATDTRNGERNGFDDEGAVRERTDPMMW